VAELAEDASFPRGAERTALPWREAGPPYHHDGKADSDQYLERRDHGVAELAEDARPEVDNGLVVFSSSLLLSSLELSDTTLYEP